MGGGGGLKTGNWYIQQHFRSFLFCCIGWGTDLYDKSIRCKENGMEFLPWNAARLWLPVVFSWIVQGLGVRTAPNRSGSVAHCCGQKKESGRQAIVRTCAPPLAAVVLASRQLSVDGAVADVGARKDLKLQTALPLLWKNPKAEPNYVLVCLGGNLAGESAKIGLMFLGKRLFSGALHYMYAYSCRAECLLERVPVGAGAGAGNPVR